MSEINFTRKVFLEREELIRFQEFLRDNTVSNAILGNTTQYGIIQTNFTSPDTNFQVGNGTNVGTIKIAKDISQALDIDGNLIRLLATDNIAVTDDSNWYWVRISYTLRRYELGTVDLNTTGNLAGTDTLFTEVLRGQATDVPVKVSFEKTDGTAAVNNGIYEVVNIVDDTNAVLTSTTGFIAENNLRIIVIGSTPIGTIVSTEQEEGIYKYDSCLIELVAETVADTPPTLPVGGEDKYFYVARVQNTANVITIQDKRDIEETYWKFAVPGIDGAVITKYLPPPAAVDEYLLLGSVPNNITSYVRLFIQGAGQSIGDILDVRIQSFDSGGGFIYDTQTHVLFGGAASGLRPTVYRYNNTTTNRLEIYLKSGSSDASLPFVPGYVSFIGENAAGGVEAWEYENSFTWVTPLAITPTQGSTLFGVYSSNALISDIDISLSTLTTNVDSNSTDIAALKEDTGWLSATVNGTEFDEPTTRCACRQVGNVVTLSCRVLKQGAASGTFVTVFTIPAAISNPGLAPGTAVLQMQLSTNDATDTVQKHAILELNSANALRIYDMDFLETIVYSGVLTYVV